MAGCHGRPGWEDGTSPATLRQLVGWWQTGFDWRTQEAAINRFPQFRATVEGGGARFRPRPREGVGAFDVVIPCCPAMGSATPARAGHSSRIPWAVGAADDPGAGA